MKVFFSLRCVASGLGIWGSSLLNCKLEPVGLQGFRVGDLDQVGFKGGI